MGNYIGFFKSVDDKVSYTVKLIGDSASTDFTEIKLAGESPFVATWEASETPFDPIRTSTATISIVHNTYLEDILSSKAQGTIVQLVKQNSTVEWMGYLTPKIYDQSYVNEYETIELEAADCLSSLQYIDYDLPNSGFVNFKTIVDSACTKSGCDGYLWPMTRKDGNGTVQMLDKFGVSSQNFFSNDTDEPWTYLEVMEEIARYMGFTLYQEGSTLIFNDYTNYRQGTTTLRKYSKYSDYGAGPQVVVGKQLKITADSFKSSDASITFCPVYNKFYVKDNMYNCENMLSDFMGDECLTNRNGDFYKYIEVTPEAPDKAKYPWKRKTKEEEIPDSDHRYFLRLFDHDKFESIYYNENGNKAYPSLTTKQSSAITRDYIGGTIVDLGTVDKKKFDDDTWQYVVPSSLDWKRYLCISMKGKGTKPYWGNSQLYPYTPTNFEEPIFKLKETFIPNCMVSKNACIVLNFSAIFERYPNRCYINPDWTGDTYKAAWWQTVSYMFATPYLKFKLKVGDKYWNGLGWTSSDVLFVVQTKRKDGDTFAVINEAVDCLNTISWEQELGEEGYCIPLKYADDINKGIEFSVHLPNYWIAIDNDWSQNQYAWLSDLSLKICEQGQDTKKEDNDIVFENEIENESINEFGDITFKLTTYSEATNPSYSHVLQASDDMSSYTFLSGLCETALSGNFQKPEENCIERYSMQYSTPTKRLSFSVDSRNCNQGTILTNCDVADSTKKFMLLGSEVDYQYNKTTITAEEIK